MKEQLAKIKEEALASFQAAAPAAPAIWMSSG